MFVCVCVHAWNVMNLLLLNDSLYGLDFTCQFKIPSVRPWQIIFSGTQFVSNFFPFFDSVFLFFTCSQLSRTKTLETTTPLEAIEHPFQWLALSHTHKITSNSEDDFKREFVELMMIYPTICVWKILGLCASACVLLSSIQFHFFFHFISFASMLLSKVYLNFEWCVAFIDATGEAERKRSYFDIFHFF